MHGGNAILKNKKKLIHVVALNTYKIPVLQLLYLQCHVTLTDMNHGFTFRLKLTIIKYHYQVFPDVFNFKYTEYLSIKSTLKPFYIEVCLYLHSNDSFGYF